MGAGLEETDVNRIPPEARSPRTLLALSVLHLLLWCAPALALNPSFDVSQYAHTSWKISEGFGKGIIWAIAQTPDGYIWLATEYGLRRFDGVRSVEWRPPAGEHLPDRDIRNLLAARDGTLWIGTAKGLVSWKAGKLIHYPEFDKHDISDLLQDREGTIWAAGKIWEAGPAVPGKVCAIKSGGVQCFGSDGRFGSFVTTLYEDSRGNLWLGAANGLWRWKPGPPERYPIPGFNRDSVLLLSRSFLEDRQGALLITGPRGIRRFMDGKFSPYPLPPGAPQFKYGKLLLDRDGSLWIGTLDSGLLHVHQGRTDVFAKADGLTNTTIESLLEDREGNIWVVGHNGLECFRDYAVATVSAKEGLSAPIATSVLATGDGSIWVGTSDGLNRWKHGQITIYRKGVAGSDSPQRAIASGANSKSQRNSVALADEINASGLPDNVIGSLYQEPHGRIWISTARGLAYFEGDKFVPSSAGHLPDYSHSPVARDSAGNLWMTSDQGLYRLSGGRVAEYFPPAKLGLQGSLATLLVVDPIHGGMWVASWQGGVVYFKDGQTRASYGHADGLGEGRVNALELDSDNILWAATEGGLSRIHSGRVATLSSKNGLPCDAVLAFTQDDTHSFWMYMACGLVRIPRPELEAWVADPKREIQATVFDVSDGVQSLAGVLQYAPRMTKAADGRVWFVAVEGVSMVDPRHLPFNNLPPPVHIEQVTADGKTYDEERGLRLPPHVRDLEIDYTALSLVDPEKVHFRFKLEGQDKDWRQVVNVRRVEYSNLPPGPYRFRVIACNNSGVWNEEGATLEFVIPPAWYQTNWFRGLCVVAFLALLYGLYRVRVAQLRAQEEKFREAIESIPAIAFVCRPDGYRSFVNKGWVEYTGLTTEQSSGSRWQAAIHAEDLDRVVARWRASLASGDPLEYETRLRRADGEYRWFMTRAVPLRDKHGKIVKWYGTATDIEDRKRAEQLQADFAHLNRVTTMGELTASLAHEIKQPITATVLSADACLQWLNHDQPNLDEVRDAAKMIVQEGKRAAEIIERLRGLYKKSPPQREQVDVNEIAQEMTVMLRGEANRFGVSMRMDLATGLPKITADRVQLQQVLMNLMLNAIEAMKETGGVVMVKSHLEERGTVMISVSDTGVGLPTENVDQIFSAFFTTKPEGSGMGLAISRSIIESHGGRLWATPNDGRGATFYFTLPADVEEVTESGAEDAIQEKN